MQTRYINNTARLPSLIRNRSTWMINVGTHKKPYNENEWELLRDSLRQAIERTLHDEDFATSCLYIVQRDPRTNKMIRRNEPVFRTRGILGIDSMVADYVIERGSKQGRIDSHILIEIVHSNTRLQFDHNAFADLLGQELELENLSFQASNIMSEDPEKPNLPLKWADGKLFVSFNSIGKQLASNAQAYLLKQTDQQTQDATNLMLGRVNFESDTLSGYSQGAPDVFRVLPPPY